MDLATAFQQLSAFFSANKEMLTILVAAIGGGLALYRFWHDRSWQNNQFAYDYAERVFDDPKVMTVLRMLDWENGSIPVAVAKEYELPESERGWTRNDVIGALRIHDDPAAAEKGAFSWKEYVIRELFDAGLARFERLGHSVAAGVIYARDLPTTLSYYAEIMVEGRSQNIREPLRRYMKRYKFNYACSLFDTIAASVPRKMRASTTQYSMTISDAERSKS